MCVSVWGHLRTCLSQDLVFTPVLVPPHTGQSDSMWVCTGVLVNGNTGTEGTSPLSYTECEGPLILGPSSHGQMHDRFLHVRVPYRHARISGFVIQFVHLSDSVCLSSRAAEGQVRPSAGQRFGDDSSFSSTPLLRNLLGS